MSTTTFNQTATDQTRISDTSARAAIYQLLPSTIAPIHDYTYGKKTTDANTVTLQCAGSDVFMGGLGASIVITAPGTVTIRPNPGVGWVIVSQTTSVSAGGTAPAAPNVTVGSGSSTVVVNYDDVNGVPYFGFGGQLTIPTTDPDYSHLVEIDVYAWPPGATARPSNPIGVIRAPFTLFSTNQMLWNVANIGPQPNTSETYVKFEFVAVNDANQATASPLTVTSITVAATSATSFPTITAVSAHYQTNGSGVPQFTLSGTLTAPADPTFASIYAAAYLYTTLGANVASTPSSGSINVQVASSGGYTPGSSVFQVDSEQFLVTAIVDNTHATVTRAYNGTTAAAHTSGTGVYAESVDLLGWIGGSQQGATAWQGPWCNIQQAANYQLELRVFSVNASGNITPNYLSVVPSSFSALNITGSGLTIEPGGISLLSDANFANWPAGWTTVSGAPYLGNSSSFASPYAQYIGFNNTSSSGGEIDSALVPCSPGQNYSLMPAVRTNGTLNSGATLTIEISFYTNTGAHVGGADVTTVVPITASSTWTTAYAVSGTAPSTASFMAARFIVGSISSGAWAIANILLVLSGSGAVGVDSDGNPIIKANSLTVTEFATGNTPTFNISSLNSTTVTGGATPTTSGSATLSLASNLSITVGTYGGMTNVLLVTGYGIPPGTYVTAGVGTSSLTLSNLATDNAPAGSVYSFVALPSPSATPPNATAGSTFPVGCVLFNDANGRDYKLRSGGIWVDNGDPGDITAGKIGANVIYANTVEIAQLQGWDGANIAVTTGLTFAGGGTGTVLDTNISNSGILLSVTGSSEQLSIGVGGIQLSGFPGPYTVYGPGAISMGSIQILGPQQTGLGNPTFTTVSQALTWCQTLYAKLAAHGLIV